MIYLVEIAGYNPATAAVVTSCFATGSGYISGSTTYLPRVKNPGHYTVSMFEPGKTGGASQVGYGYVTLVNNDGGLDYLKEYGFDGRAIVIRQVDDNGNIATLFTGTMEQPTFSWNEISFRIRDKSFLLTAPLQPNKYAGTGGIEGGTDLIGKPKPLAWGSCYNIAPVPVDTNNCVYQANDGACYFPAVYDRGILLTEGTDHATSALLLAATIADGYYDTCVSEGLIRLGAPPYGTVTATVLGIANQRAADLFQTVALRVLSAAEINAGSIIALNAAQAGYLGIYVAEESTPAAVLDEICSSVGAGWWFDGNGILNVRQFAAPGSNTLATLTASDILSIDRLQTGDAGKGVPAWRYTMQYRKNYTVQNDLAATSDMVDFAGQEYRTATPAEDASVQTRHLLATELTGTTLLVSDTVAAAEASRRLTLYGERDRLKVTCKLAALRYREAGWWDDFSASDMSGTRFYHTATVYGNYVYVVGGKVGGSSSASVIRLDLSKPTGAWDDAGVTDLPATRYQHSAEIHGTYLYIIGGYVSGSRSASVIRLDLTNPAGAWDDAGVTDLPAARNMMGSLVYGDWLYIFGGFTTVITDSVIRLDLSTPSGAWDDAGVTDFPSARRSPRMVQYGGYAYAIGGIIPTTPGTETAAVIRLNLATPSGSWDTTGVTNLPATAENSTAIVMGSYVYNIGGYRLGSLTECVALDLSNPAGAWSSVKMSLLPAGRDETKLVLYANNIYLIGGYSGSAVANTYVYRSNDNAADRAVVFEPGRDITIQMARYGMTSGKNFKIIGTEINYQAGTIVLDLWG